MASVQDRIALAARGGDLKFDESDLFHELHGRLKDNGEEAQWADHLRLANEEFRQLLSLPNSAQCLRYGEAADTAEETDDGFDKGQPEVTEIETVAGDDLLNYFVRTVAAPGGGKVRRLHKTHFCPATPLLHLGTPEGVVWTDSPGLDEFDVSCRRCWRPGHGDPATEIAAAALPSSAEEEVATDDESASSHAWDDEVDGRA